ncbi:MULTISPECIES: ABC transporter substrate-binding protein [unclassified Variovorax]|uniref:ABC transporter substrate-binding protein n=1 Tax=unclassified Variovorax TaxID=663243 RepID=UPI002577A548|nr:MULTISPECIES: ABC transporter substrate-binding protein [unclassified Variovorax]MDM0090752.1 ABC transporter substrate-binding protein [Variovorax sp. J22G40]MDM0149246.1 ABC transporter substrate-binding protein [Variovorax sp. J2P1-31]
MTATFFRRTALAMALVAVSLTAAAQEAKPVRILTNWFAQPDQAGYWQAQQDKLGAEAGIRISVLQGGPKIQTIPQVASGQAEFGIGNADDVMLARLRGAPVRAVFAHLDHVPYALVYHADPTVKGIADLQGRTFAVNIGNAYWEWTKKQYKLANTREIPVSGDLSLFRNDARMVQQGYSLYLPARMEEAGIKVQSISLASLGYRPYNVLFTTDEMIQKNPALVKATLAAVQKGWSNFVRNPSGIKPMLLEMNKQISPAVYDAANKEMIEKLLSHDLGKIGCMNDARWTELATQLRSVAFLPANFNEKQAYDRTLVPGCGS